jgi:8-oxo-dGTP diphosphatase
VPVIEATLCYVERENKVLMLHRITRPDDLHYGKYKGLGGKFEAGESALDCAKREIEEESGLLPHSLDFRGHITFPLFDGKNDWSVFLFCCQAEGQNLRHPEEGRLEWVERDRLLDLNLWEGDRHFLPWVLERRRFLARFEYSDGVYVGHTVTFIDEA